MTSHRERIVAVAATLTTTRDWSAVTMASVAEGAGVSRQTVYNAFGSRGGLAEAMVLDELARFLAVVDAAFDAHPDDAAAAVRSALDGVLARAHGNPLLRAIAAATEGADTELLPLLTSHAGSLREAVAHVLHARLTSYPVDAATLPDAVDAVVRLALSHVLEPSAGAAASAASLTWAAERLLGIGPPAGR